MSLRSYLRLMRIPNVFTAFANVAAGVLLARGGQFEARDLLLVGASGSLYCGGMVWNDYCDRHVDAQERPDRPIPSGEISPNAAAAVGGALFALGLALCARHGFLPLLVSVLLCAAILLYDGSLKNTWAGPLAMGSCRALNVVLGLSVVAPEAWYSALPLPVLLGIFTLLITQLSRFEVGGTDAGRVHNTLLGFAALAAIVTLALFAGAALRQVDALSWLATAALLAYILWRGTGLLRPLWSAATGPSLGKAIGGGILLMPAIDASFVAASGAPLAAAAVFGFTAPALLLKRWYYLT